MQGVMSRDTTGEVLTNNGTHAIVVSEIVDAQGRGETDAHLYLKAGETMRSKGRAPYSGAGYYQAVPGNYYLLSNWYGNDFNGMKPIGFEGFEEDTCWCALLVDRVEWDHYGQLIAIAGLRPVLETMAGFRDVDPGDIAITSDVKNPKIANGNLYFTLAGHGATEYWAKIQYGQIIAMGKHQANLVALPKTSPPGEPYREIQGDDFRVGIEGGLWEIGEQGAITDRTITRFNVANDGGEVEVELTSKALLNGRIQTKRFGTLIAKINGPYWAFYATESQVRKMKQLLEQRSEGSQVPQKENIVAGKVNISAGVTAGLLLDKTPLVYPPIAKAARVQGTVVLKATISKTGTVETVSVVSGPAMLQQAALDAVKTYRYKPYLLNNKPTEVVTTVNVIFVLGG